MTEHAVVVAGGGPTGMVLAAELTLAGADVVVVEPRATTDLEGTRAGGLHARTLEILDQRGVVDRFLAEGQVAPVAGYAYIPLDLRDFPSRHRYVLALWQQEIERLLAAWLAELGVPVRRSAEVVGLAQDDDGVDVSLSDGSVLRAGYLVGCDGGRSLVRKAAGIEFPGHDAAISFMIAQVTLDDPEIGVRREGGGIGPVDRVHGGNPYGVVLREPRADNAEEPTLEDLRSLLVDRYGTEFGARDPISISRFTDASRQAATYRSGRVLLAGDAAHIHSPMGGQGLNTGVQDAVNLGWKLAQVVAGTSPPSLLDTYHDERHPVGARVLANTLAQGALVTPDDRHDLLRAQVAELLALDEPRRRVAAMLTGLDIHYDLGDGHPLLGRRMPDLDLVLPDGDAVRVASLLHSARGVLLELGEASPTAFDIGPWAGRVDLVAATYDGEWELPVLGSVPTPGCVLIRPDGHVAWTGALGDTSLVSALDRWFGAPATE